MTKLLFKENPFTNSVMYSLDHCLSHLEQASREISMIDIPYGFSQGERLRSCLSDIQRIKREISSLITWGNDSTKKIKTKTENMRSTARLLPKGELRVKNVIVR